MNIGVHEFWSFILIFTRVTAMFVSAPVYGHHSVPRNLKIGFGGLIALILVPIISPLVGPAPADLITLVGRVVSELAIGVTIGYLASFIMMAFQIAGQFVDTQMGFGIINTLNPLSEQHTSAMGTLISQLAMTLFLIMGGHLVLISAIASSYATVGPGAAHFSGDFTGTVSQVATDMFGVAFKVAAPAAAVLLIVDVAFAIIARTVPQMNVFLVGIPAKIIIGLMTLAMVLPALAMMVSQMTPLIGASTDSFLRAAR